MVDTDQNHHSGFAPTLNQRPMNACRPDIFWVVADSTNAGKTTVSCAVLRHLNGLGVKAIGFKPHGGMNLRTDYDFIAESSSKGPFRLYGDDTVKLAAASDLSGEGLVEVIGPVRVMGHLGQPILVRSGSLALNDREFFRTSAFSRLFRPDQTVALESILSFPIATAPVLELDSKVRLRIKGAFDDGKIQKSYKRLLSLRPRAIVMEGAGYYLPVWRGAPAANHVFHVRENRIELYPNLDLRFAFSPLRRAYNMILRRDPLPTTKHLKRFLAGQARVQLGFEPRHSNELDAYARSIVAELMRDGGIGLAQSRAMA